MVTRTVDYSALTRVVSRQEIAAFREQMRAVPAYSTPGNLSQVIGLALGGAIVLLFLLGVVSMMIQSLLRSGSGGILSPVALVAALMLAGVATVIVLALWRAVGPGRWERMMRLSQFAQGNGLSFSPSDDNPQYPGSIFLGGSNRVALDHFRSVDGRFIDYGNYRYVTGSGKNATTHNWGFLALRLDRSLPHMVLDSRANNGLLGSNLPATFSTDQVLSLEGDFDRFFTLYCPRQYERDALYLFTPDLMALLIDEAAPFDVEILDQWMFVYSSSPFDPARPAVHQRLLRIVDTISQSDRYTDERVGDFAANLIAPQGQRLRRRIPIGGMILVGIFLLVWLSSLVSDIIAEISGR